jgi:uncharacterized heparinase superfamily protein
MDTGRPPPMPLSQEAHAGCLSFELSSGRHRIVVNCGLPMVGRESWRHFARTTAAHSTLVFGGVSSCRFLRSAKLQRLLGAPVLDGPDDVTMTREHTAEGFLVRASHDGYAKRIGLIHERSMMLSADGRRIDGEDILKPAYSRMPRRGADNFAVRFHLHPGVSANPLTHRNGVALTLPNREVWTFEAHENAVTIEESVYLAGPHGPQRTTQLVIHAHARQSATVMWSFVAMDVAESNRLAVGREEPLLPL